jgi:hypothetical protein
MTNDNSPLHALVLAALANAAANGCNFAGWTPDEIALDMMDDDSDIANYALDACGPNPERLAEIVAIVTEARKA